MERVERLRQLLSDCGINPEGLSEEQVQERSSAIQHAVGQLSVEDARILDEQIRDEFVLKDATSTMATMAPDPYLTYLPTLTGGTGTAEVARFYREFFIPGWPADTQVVPVSRTIGQGRVVDERIVSFTHDRRMETILPGLEPTGKRVQLPQVVVAGLKAGKVASKDIYWDQGSALCQLGLIDPQKLPVVGAEAVRRLLNPQKEPVNQRLRGW